MSDNRFDQPLSFRPGKSLNEPLAQAEAVEAEAPKKNPNPPPAPGMKDWEFKSMPFKKMRPKIGLIYDTSLRQSHIFDNREYTEDLVDALKAAAVLESVRYNRTFVDEKLAELFTVMKEHADCLIRGHAEQWMGYYVQNDIEWANRFLNGPGMLLELAVRFVQARQRWLADPVAQANDRTRPVPKTVVAIDAFMKEYHDPDVKPLIPVARFPDFGAILDELDKKGVTIGQIEEDGYEATPDLEYN